jgi:O-antigen/teichoic acid export membrane protein
MSDQAVVSLGNFLLAITLARSLNKVEYGTYIVIFGALLVANALHAALVVYPLSVLGAHRSASELKRLAASSMLITLCMGVPVSGVLIATAWLFTKRTDLFVFVVAAMFAWQIQETLRRSLMSHLRHRAAIFGDTVTYIGQVTFVYATAHYHVVLTSRIGFEAIIVGSAAGALVHGIVLGVRLPEFSRLLDLLKQYFQLGRYPLLSNLGFSGTVLLFPWVLASRGLAEVANYQTMMNVIQVVNPIMFSVGNLVIPGVAHELLKPNGEARAKRITFRYMLEGLALLALPFLALLLAPHFVMASLYGHTSGYTEHDTVLRVLVIGAFAMYLSHVLHCYFLGKQRVGIVLRTQFIASAAAAICAFALIPLMGLSGAALSYITLGAGRTWLLVVALRVDSQKHEVPEECAVSVEKA